MNTLIRYDTARRALAEARAVDEVKDIRDKAEAMAAYARQARDQDLIAWATEIKIRAERKCGEMLKEGAKNGTRATRETARAVGSNTTMGFDTPTLSGIGISPNQSSRWQKLADMPEEHFETAVATAKEHAGQVTTAHMLRVADELRKISELKAEIAAAERHNAAHPNPDEIALRVWGPIDSSITEVQRDIAGALQATTLPPCPPQYAERLLRQWASISEFLSLHVRSA